jgi:hypothetical protein
MIAGEASRLTDAVTKFRTQRSTRIRVKEHSRKKKQPAEPATLPKPEARSPKPEAIPPKLESATVPLEAPRVPQDRHDKMVPTGPAVADWNYRLGQAEIIIAGETLLSVKVEPETLALKNKSAVVAHFANGKSYHVAAVWWGIVVQKIAAGPLQNSVFRTWVRFYV